MPVSLLLFVLSLGLVSVNSTSHAMMKPGEEKLLSNVHLRLPIFINPPLFFAEQRPGGNVTYKGADKDFVDWLATSLNFTYSFVPLDQTLAQKQGPIQTMIDMLVNESCDFIVTPLVRSWNRKAYIDFCYPHAINSFKITSPWPKEMDRILIPIKPFTATVWILIVTSFFITAFFLGILTTLESRFESTLGITTNQNQSLSVHFTRYLNYVVTNALSQDDYMPVRQQSVRLLLSAWLLMIVVIVNAYCCQLASYLTLPVYEKTIDSFEDVARRTDVPLVTAVDSVFLQTLMDARSGPHKLIADSIRRHPEHLFSTLQESFQKIFSGKYVYANVQYYVEVIISKDYNEHKRCRLAISKALPFSSQISYAMPKNGPFNEIINNRIIFVWERGLVDGWMRPYRGQYERCIFKAAKPKMDKLKIMNFHSAFIILGLGTTLSLLVFAFERIKFTYLNRQK